MSYNIIHIYPEGPCTILVRGVVRVRARVRYYFWSGSQWGSVPVVVQWGAGVGSSPCPYSSGSWVVSLGSVAGTVCKGPCEGPNKIFWTWIWSETWDLGPTDPIDRASRPPDPFRPPIHKISKISIQNPNFQNFPNPKFFILFLPITKSHSKLTNSNLNKFPIQTSLHSKIFFHFFNIFIYQTIKSKNYHTNIKQYFHIFLLTSSKYNTTIYTSLFQVNNNIVR